MTGSTPSSSPSTGSAARPSAGPTAWTHGDRIVRHLVDTHLLRSESRRGTTWYELAHDRLVGPVRDRNATWRQAHLDPVELQAALWETEGRPDHRLLAGAELEEGEALGGRAIWRPLADRPRLHRPLRGRAPGAHRRPVQAHRPHRWRARAHHGVGGGLRRLAGEAGLGRCGRGDYPRAHRPLDRPARDVDPALSALLALEASSATRARSTSSLAAGRRASTPRRPSSPDEFVSTTRAPTTRRGVRARRPDHRHRRRNDGAAVIWDAATGQSAHHPRRPHRLGQGRRLRPRRPHPRHRQRRHHRHHLGHRHRPTPHTLAGHTDWVKGIAYAPDGQTLATASDDTTAIIWDTATGQPAHHPHRPHRLPERRRLRPRRPAPSPPPATTPPPSSGTPPPARRSHASPATPTGSGRSPTPPTASTVATASDDDTAIIWDATTGQPLHTLTGHTDWVKGRRLRPRRQTPRHRQRRPHRHHLGHRHRPTPAHPHRPHRLAQRRRLRPRRPDPRHRQRRHHRHDLGRRHRPTAHHPRPDHPRRELGVRRLGRPPACRGHRRRHCRPSTTSRKRRRDGSWTSERSPSPTSRSRRADESLVSGDDAAPSGCGAPTRAASHASCSTATPRSRTWPPARDGRLIAVATAVPRPDVEIIDLDENDARWQISDIDADVVDLAFEPDGDVLAVAQADGTVSSVGRGRPAIDRRRRSCRTTLGHGPRDRGLAESWRVAAAYDDGTWRSPDVTGDEVASAAGRAQPPATPRSTWHSTPERAEVGGPDRERRRVASARDGLAARAARWRVLLDFVVPDRHRLRRAGDGRGRRAGRQRPDVRDGTVRRRGGGDRGLRCRRRPRGRTGRLRDDAGGVVPWDLGESLAPGRPYGRTAEGDPGGALSPGAAYGTSDEGDLGETVSPDTFDESADDGHQSYVNDVDYSPDGTRVASAGGDAPGRDLGRGGREQTRRGSRATRTRCWASTSRRTGASWRQPAGTAPSGCGMPPRATPLHEIAGP